MIVDIYKYFKEHPAFNKLIGADYLLLEYKCPIDTEKFQLFSEMHFITFVISGKKDWILNNKTITIESGDAIFVRKGVYTTRQYFEVDHCVMLFFMTDDFIKNFILENNSAEISYPGEIMQDQIFEIDVNDSLQSLFFSVFNYLKQQTTIPQRLVEIKFKELLFNLILNPKNAKLATFFNSLTQSSKNNLDYVMMKNFQHDLQLEDFARLCGKSLSTFKREFKTFYHQTPGKWLNDKRLEYARALLLTSDLNINEICLESGFRNSSHFNKAFKEKYQLPPKQFREFRKTALTE